MKKNTQREYDAPAYYHIYNRGASKMKIFLDAKDKHKFMSILARYLDPEDQSVRGDGMQYEKVDAKLVAYCLMGNHFHLFLYQPEDTDAVRMLLSCVQTSYSMYFNLRHKHSGHLFEGPFRAVRMTDESQFVHLSRYVHLNPQTYKTYKWSSLQEYLKLRHTAWVYPELVTDLSPADYMKFVEDYTDRKNELKKLRRQLGL